MERRGTRAVKVGGLTLGSGHPVRVQSMLNAPAADVAVNVRQAEDLERCGCEIIRVSVPTMQDVRLITALKKAVTMPVVADIHYDYRIALACLAEGVDKIRINPGNIGSASRVEAVAKGCREHGVPIRIGVNGGSLSADILARFGGPSPEALVESALNQARQLQAFDFEDVVISIKSSHVPTMVRAYRLLAAQTDAPLHLGVTEAGTYHAGLVKNAVGIGSLLLEGIGDTLRVSLTDDPAKEVQAGKDILRAAGHPVAGCEVISCPTCGRTCIPVAEIAAAVEAGLADEKRPLKVAVMGCVVNGLGEGREADIGIAGGKDCAVLFIKGQQVGKVTGDYAEALIKAVRDFDLDTGAGSASAKA